MDIDHNWCHSLYYTDPNGIMIEFCVDTPGFKADPAEAHRQLSARRTNIVRARPMTLPLLPAR